MGQREPPDVVAGRDAGLTVPSVPRSVGVARRFAVDACVALGWSSLTDTVALLVTEVATNAVLHARGRHIRVRVSSDEGRLRIEVDDDSAETPEPRDPEEDDEGGRGLLLVHALAQGWGFDRRPEGKTFWFEIDVQHLSDL